MIKASTSYAACRDNGDGTLTVLSRSSKKLATSAVKAERRAGRAAVVVLGNCGEVGATFKSPSHRTDCVLWGIHPEYAGGVPIKIAGGSARELRPQLRERAKQGFTGLVILTEGESYADYATA